MFVKWTSTVRRTAHEEPRRTMRPSLTQTTVCLQLSWVWGKVLTLMLKSLQKCYAGWAGLVRSMSFSQTRCVKQLLIPALHGPPITDTEGWTPAAFIAAFQLRPDLGQQ